VSRARRRATRGASAVEPIAAQAAAEKFAAMWIVEPIDPTALASALFQWLRACRPPGTACGFPACDLVREPDPPDRMARDAGIVLIRHNYASRRLNVCPLTTLR
jgi:hypothetical protein